MFMTILEVLKTLRDAANGKDYEPSFSYRPGVGICWHVYAHAPCVQIGYLVDAFEIWGLDETYPVEMQVHDKEGDAVLAYHYAVNKYDPETKEGKIRMELLDKLIEHLTE